MESPPTPPKKLSIPGAFDKISEHWKPKLVGSINNQVEIKVVKLKGPSPCPTLPESVDSTAPASLAADRRPFPAGEFTWHSHNNTDEVFHLLSGGPLTIQFRAGDVVLEVGEMLVIPKDIEHCPKAENECSVLLIEGVGTVNDGEAGR
jgi:mannose-6-phosphate isomerase-like protein (cupin superfamily)